MGEGMAIQRGKSGARRLIRNAVTSRSPRHSGGTWRTRAADKEGEHESGAEEIFVDVSTGERSSADEWLYPPRADTLPSSALNGSGLSPPTALAKE
jgi:hypothetical protein